MEQMTAIINIYTHRITQFLRVNMSCIWTCTVEVHHAGHKTTDLEESSFWILKNQ
jgi:hypothetical protein